MFNNILKYLKEISEGAGAIDASEPSNDRKRKCFDDEYSEDDEESFDEEIFDTKVKHGKVLKTRRTMGDVEKVADIHNNANLVKARLKSNTPKAKVNKKHSMLVRKRLVDREG